MFRKMYAFRIARCPAVLFGIAVVFATILFSGTLPAQDQENENKVTGNQVMAEVQFTGKTKAEKTAGVWVDGQYVGYASELKGDKKVLLLPGEHNISVRQTGYLDFTQKIVTEPGKKNVLTVTLEKDPQAEFSASNGQIKLKATPERAAVFVDGKFAGTANQFQGVGRAMVIAAGNHHIKIALVGYQPFETDVSVLANQKITIKTELVQGSILQADPAIKKN